MTHSKNSPTSTSRSNKAYLEDSANLASLPAHIVHDVVSASQHFTVPELVRSAETGGWAAESLDLPKLWKQSKGSGVKVAVLDTGCDLKHPDLKGAVIKSETFVGGRTADDKQGHGTHCAGIIGAREDGKGFVGAAPECKLIIGKVLDDRGSGTMRGIAQGIVWAAKNGADIISMSLGAPSSDRYLHDVIHEVLADGIIVIAAAGNSGRMGDNTVGYPGKYGSVLSIGSHGKSGEVSGFSSRGGEVDFLGPGENIWSTYPNGKYASLSGTSMATPFCAGVAALILSKHKKRGGRTPINNTEDMRNHFMKIAAHAGYFDSSTGYGPLLPFKYVHR